MGIGHKHSKNDDSTIVNQTLYGSIIGKLQYVVQSRLDISVIVGIIVIFSINPKENHMMVVTRILRYLQGTKNYGLYYKKNENFELTVYIDVDWSYNAINCSKIV